MTATYSHGAWSWTTTGEPPRLTEEVSWLAFNLVEHLAEVLTPTLQDHYKIGEAKGPLELLCPCYCHCYNSTASCHSPNHMRWSPEFSQWVQILKTVLRSMPGSSIPGDINLRPTNLPIKCVWSCAAAAAEAECRAEADSTPFITFNSRLASYFQ